MGMNLRQLSTIGLLFFESFILAFGINYLCLADVYKYKDEQGKWHYSDKPPSGGQAEESIEGVTKKKPASSNLNDELQEFPSKTPIEKATLAVVTIETPLGHGSGFFVSTDGYILTNKHVVRPSESTGLQELQNNVKQLEEVYREAEKEIKHRGAELRDMKKTLDEYKKEIVRESGSSTRAIMKEEYEIYNRRYKAYKKEFNAVNKSFKSKKYEFNNAKRKFNIAKNTSKIKNNFDIVIKGEKHLTARLVSISKEYDLALLKVDGYETPSIEFAKVQSISHGSTVYAIGSPLGIKGVVTSGVIMKIEDDYIMTDATILPGNSGGPLINKSGQVVGINTIKIIETVTQAAESFSIAIPINVASNEFKKILRN